jgi:hypothetical protein
MRNRHSGILAPVLKTHIKIDLSNNTFGKLKVQNVINSNRLLIGNSGNLEIKLKTVIAGTYYRIYF